MDPDEACTPPRGKLLQFSPGVETKYTLTLTSGISKSSRQEFQRSATWSVNVELDGGYKAGDKGGVEIASKGSTSYAETVTTTTAMDETSLAGQEQILEYSYQAPPGGAALVTWSLVEQTVISRPDATLVACWEVNRAHNSLRWPEALTGQPTVTNVSKKDQN